MSPAEEAALRQSDRSGWLLVTPALVVLGLAAILPLLVMLVYSFLTPGEFGNVEWQFSWDGWVSILFQRDIFEGTLGLADAHLTIFWRSIWLSVVTTILAFVIGFPTAWFIATRPPSERPIWLFLVTIPFWTNLLIRTFAILEVIRSEGLINTALMKAGLISEPIQMLYTDGAVLAGMAYVYLPLMVLPLYAAIDRFDMRMLEAAYDLYASRWMALRRVILPIVSPGIVAGSILVFVPSLGAYVTPRVLGGGKNMMIGNFIELQFGQGRNWPLGAALSMTLLVIVTVALLFYVRAANRGARQAMAERFAVNRLPGFTTIAVLAFLALYIPIITLVFFSFNAGKTVTDWGGFSLQWYVVAWQNTAVQEAAWRSVVIAFWATVIATTVATMAALGTTRRRAFKGQTAVYVAINQPLMVPEIVTAVALLIVFAWVKVQTGYQGLGYLILAHGAFCIPFAYLPIRARLEGMDLSLETAAADLYATPWRTFRRVTLPLMAPGIVAGAMLAFITSLDDVVITEFVKSAGQDTLPTYMLGQLRRGVTPEVNAISTVLLGLTVVILTAFFLITRERR